MKILIKIGSALLTKNNKPNIPFLKRIVKEISNLNKKHEIILVSSGAVAFGMEIQKLSKKPKDTIKLQMLSGLGQTKLTENYRRLFNKNKTKIAQVLLTHHNLSTEKEKEIIKKILNEYLKRNIIPIINENDIISKEEFSDNGIFSDNDILSALIGKELKIDLAILLTNVNGVFDLNPKNKSAKIIPEIKNITPKTINNTSGKSKNGRGGMESKLKAAKILQKNKIDTIIANGNFSLNKIIKNRINRTIIHGKRTNI